MENIKKMFRWRWKLYKRKEKLKINLTHVKNLLASSFHFWLNLNMVVYLPPDRNKIWLFRKVYIKSK